MQLYICKYAVSLCWFKMNCLKNNCFSNAIEIKIQKELL